MTVDHLGNEYQTEKEMLQKYKIQRNTFYRRLQLGWSLEKALTEPAHYPKHMMIISEEKLKKLRKLITTGEI